VRPASVNIAELDPGEISDDLLTKSVATVRTHFVALGATDSVAKGSALVERLASSFPN
jgi:hypothetical protein